MKKLLLPILSAIVAMTLCHPSTSAQSDGGQYFVAGVAFYNLENLFDTINQNGRYDLEYTPEGRRAWDTERYNNKLDNLADAIISMATPETPNGPGVIGVAEVENETVVKDLVARIDSRLQAEGRPAWGLKYVHHDSPDPRGIDVALLYNPDYFEVTNTNYHRFTLADEPNFKTRDQMVVSGLMLGCPLSVVVNHWPSRLGGQKESEYRRVAAGQLTRHVVDSIRGADPTMGVVVMGDLNDDPADKSVTEGLGAQGDRAIVAADGLFNPFTWILANGVGTLCYQGRWNLFDQIIVSGNMLSDKVGDELTYWKATVHNGEMLRTQSGKYKNYPRRTFSGDNYLNGYSDHFPTEIFLVVKL